MTPISGPGRYSDGPAAGFTLIELLVAITVMAVLAVSATLALSGRAPPARLDAERFARSVAQQRALAIEGQGMRGLRVDAQAERLALPNATGGWADGDTALTWRSAVDFAPLVPRGPRFGAAGDAAPEIVFLPDGRFSGFRVEFQSKTLRVTCRSDGWELPRCAAS